MQKTTHQFGWLGTPSLNHIQIRYSTQKGYRFTWQQPMHSMTVDDRNLQLAGFKDRLRSGASGSSPKPGVNIRDHPNWHVFFFLGGVKAINYFLVNHPIIDSKSPCFSKSPMIFMIDFLIKTSIYGDYELETIPLPLLTTGGYWPKKSTFNLHCPPVPSYWQVPPLRSRVEGEQKICAPWNLETQPKKIT